MRAASRAGSSGVPGWEGGMGWQLSRRAQHPEMLLLPCLLWAGCAIRGGNASRNPEGIGWDGGGLIVPFGLEQWWLLAQSTLNPDLIPSSCSTSTFIAPHQDFGKAGMSRARAAPAAAGIRDLPT